MEFQLNLDPEKLEHELVQAIIGSTLGEHIKAAVDNAIKAHPFGSGSVVEQAVAKAVNNEVVVMVRGIIRDPDSEIHKAIEAALYEALSEERLRGMIEGLVGRMGLMGVDSEGNLL